MDTFRARMEAKGQENTEVNSSARAKRKVCFALIVERSVHRRSRSPPLLSVVSSLPDNYASHCPGFGLFVSDFIFFRNDHFKK